MLILYFYRALVAALFKESAQLDPIYWFFIICSLVQASVGLICSTILIILFSDDRHWVSCYILILTRRVADVTHKISLNTAQSTRIGCAFCSGTYRTISPSPPYRRCGMSKTAFGP